MLKRLGKGLLVGAGVGALVAYAFAGVGFVWGTAAAYLGAILVGAITGLFAGKPVWARGAKIEVALKVLVGATVVAIAMLGVRRWLGGVHVDLGAVGTGALPDLPLAVLPLLGAAFALVLEIDDAFGSEGEPVRARLDVSGIRASSDSHEIEAEEDAEEKRSTHEQ